MTPCEVADQPSTHPESGESFDPGFSRSRSPGYKRLMRALVTGGAGFIGSHIVGGLVDLGAEVLVVDNLSRGKRDNVPPDAAFVQTSNTSPEVERVVA